MRRCRSRPPIWHGVCDVSGMKVTVASIFPPVPRWFLVGAIACVALGLVAPGTAKALANQNICAQAIRSVEPGADIPNALLTAISHVESGRWNPKNKALFAWPWTVTNGPDGQYFPNKAAAIAHVHKLREKGIRNIAVGCMQINLKYHPNAFDDLESALDPKTNVRYAAKLLNTLFDAHKSWRESIRRYHSSNPKFNRPYHDKVVRQWNSSRQVTAAEHRRRVIAAHRAQREKWRNERAAQIADARAAAQCELAAHCRRTAGPHRTEHHPHSSAPKRHRARILCACQLDGSRTSNGAHVDRRIL